MKAIVPFKVCTIEINSENVKDLFREIASLAEILMKKSVVLVVELILFQKQEM